MNPSLHHRSISTSFHHPYLSQIRMPIKRKCIPKTPLKRRIYILPTLRLTIRICLHAQYSSPLDTFRTMTIEIRYPSIDSLPHHIAFPTHILSSNLCTGHMNAIVDGIHVCATEINGVNEFMDHGLVGMVCIDDVLLTEEYFGEETEFGLIGIPSDDLLLEVLHCSFLIALSLSSFVCLCLILAVIVVIVIVIIITIRWS
mmetsp:Transcript_16991/g.24966  ORF Transcript_16991/g.24966 Transcript_16991/m.24966 type:complete len:200 (-) Transcript_16991:534-1133(-)